MIQIIQPELFHCEESHVPSDILQMSADFYLVVAYTTRMGQPHWKVWPDQWTTSEAAEKAAQTLLPHWTCRRLLHVSIPFQEDKWKDNQGRCLVQAMWREIRGGK